MKKTFLRYLLIIILIASYVGVFFVMSVIDLFNTKDVYEVNINVAGQLITIENSINGIIPTGKDYYYVGVDDSKGDIYVIHAGKHWLEDNFDENGVAHGNNIIVKGLSKRASDFEVEKEIANRVYQIADDSNCNLVLEPGKVIEVNYVRDAVLKIIAGMLILVVGIVMLVFKKKSDEIPTWARKAFLILLIVTLAFALWAIL